jgi:hypothetical protein
VAKLLWPHKSFSLLKLFGKKAKKKEKKKTRQKRKINQKEKLEEVTQCMIS